MRNYLIKLGSASVAALLMTVASSAFASGKADHSSGKSIFENGKGDVPACNSCHGAEGLGDDNMGTPRLAGQIDAFLLKQLTDFATDKRLDTTMFVMNANAKGLSEQDRRDVAGYLSSLRSYTGKQLQEAHGGSDMVALEAAGVEVGKSHLGKIIVNYGVPERGIPACLACHGHSGRGVGPLFPRIGEQKFTYLVSQLNKFKTGERNNDVKGAMQKVAQKLTAEDILNVATYLTQAPPTTMGNTRIPVEHIP